MSQLNHETYATFWEHAEELRKVFAYIILTIATGLILALANYKAIIGVLKYPFENSHNHLLTGSHLVHQRITHTRIANPTKTPLHYVVKDHEKVIQAHQATATDDSFVTIDPGGYLDLEVIHPVGDLVLLGPIEGMTIMLKVCFWSSLVLTAPIWLYLLSRFVAPALPYGTSRLLLTFSMLSFCFMGMGFLLAFYFTIPIANQYLMLFNDGLGSNLWSLAQYLDYTVFLLLGSGLSFELFLILLILVHFGKITSDMMIGKRRHFCILALVLGAILTPPDVLTQLMLAIPLIGLYELAILYARCCRRRLLRARTVC